MAICVVFTPLLCACASSNLDPSPEKYLTEDIPDGWIADFSYREPLGQYIREQAHRALAVGKLPLVYFYSDDSGFCEYVRRQARSDYFQPIFQDTLNRS